MLQSMLLLVEIIFLGATAGLYWSTRKAAQEGRALRAQAEKDAGHNNVKTARDVAKLLADLQMTAGNVRDDLTRQQIALQTMLDKAAARTEELRSMLAQIETTSDPAAVPLAIEAEQQLLSRPPRSNAPSLPRSGAVTREEPSNCPEQDAESVLTFTVFEAVARFQEYLYADGRSDKSVTRTVSDIETFAIWRWGQDYEQTPLTLIDEAEFDDYLSYLKEQDYQPGTVKRKINAAKSFRVWTSAALEASERPSPDRPEATLNLQTQRTILTLAAQGLDHRSIAARTGMEHETVRMLLALKGNQAVFANPGLFTVRESLLYADTSEPPGDWFAKIEQRRARTNDFSDGEGLLTDLAGLFSE